MWKVLKVEIPLEGAFGLGRGGGGGAACFPVQEKERKKEEATRCAKEAPSPPPIQPAACQPASQPAHIHYLIGMTPEKATPVRSAGERRGVAGRSGGCFLGGEGGGTCGDGGL